MKKWIATVALLVAVCITVPVRAQQDVTTLLSQFLNNLVSGTISTSSTTAKICLGPCTASFPMLKRGGTTVSVRLGDDSADATLNTGAFNFLNKINGGTGATLMSSTAPSSPVCGTSSTVTNNNGTAVFVVNGGTGGTATGCVVTMPATTTGWACDITNITSSAAHRADRTTIQTASTTTSVTFEYQAVSTGAATAFTASDLFSATCMGY